MRKPYVRAGWVGVSVLASCWMSVLSYRSSFSVMKKSQDRGAPGPTAWVTSLTEVTRSSVRAYAHTCTSAQAPCCTETELYHTPPLSKRVRWEWLTLAALRRISLSCSSFLCFSILSSCSKKRSCERTSAVCS